MKRQIEIFARFISLISNPLLMMGLVAAVFGFVTGHWYTVLALFCAVIILALMIAVAVRLGTISDFELSRRQERPWFVLSAAGLIGLTGLVHDVVFWPYYVAMLLWLVLFGTITLRWKISGHTGIATLVVLFLTKLVGDAAILLGLLIPLIAWSRVHLGRHTRTQVIGGTVLSLVVVWVSWFFWV